MKNEKAKVEMVQFSVPRLAKKELENLQFLLLERIHFLVESVLEDGEPLNETFAEISSYVSTLKKLN
tara:strand:+ start:779 stop:979 length:201 start_codon:yes stop_codon:yes gene_type:complete